MTEHTGACYDAIAAKYAEAVDTKPWNAFYDRPAVLSLLPALENRDVLDAGCGSGWYAEYLAAQGARVTAIDLTQAFVEMTQARVGERARVLQADLSQPLEFADGAFDLVVCPLVLHYLKDWLPTLREFHRVLRTVGVLVFSTHHPFMDWKLFDTEDYFAVELLRDEWDVGKVDYYRRPLTVISSDVETAGFCIERLLEPQPTEEFRRANPETHEMLMKNPWFLAVRAIRKNDPSCTS